MNYQNSSAELWYQFKESLVKILTSLPPNELNRLNDYSDRKNFFKSILPSVATGMHLEAKPEFLRIDYVFRKKGPDKWDIPLVAIESENKWESCYEEALKLCSTTAPLKIIITYGSHKQVRKELEGEESNDHYIFKDFLATNVLVGWYLILLCERINQVFRFEVYPYNNKGELIESEKTHFDIPVNFS